VSLVNLSINGIIEFLATIKPYPAREFVTKLNCVGEILSISPSFTLSMIA